MSTTQQYGPTPEQLSAKPARYFAHQKDLSGSEATSGLFGSPLVFGASDSHYKHYIQYFHDRSIVAELDPDTGSIGSKYGFWYPWHSSNVTFPWTSNQSNIRAQSFAGDATGFVQDSGNARPSSQQVSQNIVKEFVDRINSDAPGQGLFASLTSQLPDNFAIALAKDFDVLTTNGDGDRAGDFASYDYWRHYHRHPLGPIYSRFYDDNKQSGLFTNNFKLSHGRVEPNYPEKHYSVVDWRASSQPVALISGPFSGTHLKLGDGNNIVASSPVMTAAFHRKRALNGNAAYHPDSYYDSQTILYPSSVGRFGSNELTLGNGNNVVYYDSSYSKVRSGSGHNIFIPSFGSFSWSVDWLNRAYNDKLNGENGIFGYPRDYFAEMGKALISPIPWENVTKSPINGTESDLGYMTQANQQSKVTLGARDTTFAGNANLYTVNSEWSDNNDGRILKHYFNGSVLNGQNYKSYNPVNKVGGTTLKASGGDNVFYGFDPNLWKGVANHDGTTTANQMADNAAYKRAATNSWNTITMLGGPGSNYFWLGNVIDDITNNAKQYAGDASYKLSLTHDKIYEFNELNRPENRGFGNIYLSGDGRNTLTSIVNLSMQADPSTISVISQQADPGRSGPSAAQQAGPYNSVANAVNKGFGNSEKAFSSYASFLKSNDTKYPATQAVFKTFSKLVPWVDFGCAAASAVIGLVGLFSTKAAPPKQEISATYTDQGLETALKAVRVNDWHPYAKINLNIPVTNPDAWKSLAFELHGPIDGSVNTRRGSYLNVRKTVQNPPPEGSTKKTDPTQTNYPLVVLDNVDREDALFGYYSFDFLDGQIGQQPLDPADDAINAFTRIGRNEMALMATLPDPQKVLDANGNPASIVTIPGRYGYFSDEGFDMRNDAMNAAAFRDGDPSNDYYSRYYFSGEGITPNVQLFPAGWSVSGNLWTQTTVVSLEFDSRQLGWYWQPVLKQTADTNPDNAEIDFEQSKLWISPGRGKDWKSYSFVQLGTNTEAYKNSLMARTFYHLKGAEYAPDQDPAVKIRLYQDLTRLQALMPDLAVLNQSLIANADQRLSTLAQINSVEEAALPDLDPTAKVLKIGYEWFDANGTESPATMLIYQASSGELKALPADQKERELALKKERLASLIGAFTEKLEISTYWKMVERGAPQLDSLDQVRDVEFDVDTIYSVPHHRITYADASSGSLHRMTIVPNSEKPGFWTADYDGALVLSSSKLVALPADGGVVSDLAVQSESLKGPSTADQGRHARLLGDAADNRLAGHAGKDLLWGQEGGDTLVGGADRDRFLFKANRSAFDVSRQGLDLIVDFANGQDKIALDRKSFSLPSSRDQSRQQAWFAVVDHKGLAETSAASIVFSTAEHTLFFNANGASNGFGSRGGAFATLNADAVITADSFVFV